MGRTLRYEPARAFRTLLVSYRTPVQVLSPSGSGGRTQSIMLDLPYAMRLWKPKDSKYFNVVYNAEAVDLEKRCGGTSASNQFLEGRLFMHPMVFDGEAIRSIASFFGALECFERLKLNETAERRQAYPFPHNGPRNACMDGSCWEVKWKHRDNCVSALMALRRIPHLTVTWAHQLSQSLTAHLGTRQEEAKTTVTAFWSTVHDCELTSCSRDVSDSPMSCAPAGVTLPQDGNNDDAELSFARSIDHKTPFDYDLQQDMDGVGGLERVKLNWSDEDFEPAINSREFPATQWTTWQDQETNQPIIENKAIGDDQLDVVSTPGLGMSPITPKSLGSDFPSTPTDLSVELSGLSLDPKLNSGDSYNNNSVFKGKPVDPTTLFVGGLEMFGPDAWDEDKVRKCFEKYGALENVKFVRPYNSCSAFAFVKFKSIDAPTHAIREEHNRIYEGRAIRVQLRECNVPRGTWKPLRTRGRYTGSHSCPSKRLEIIDKGVDSGAQSQSQADIMSGAESMSVLQSETESAVNHNAQSLTEFIRSENSSETTNPTTGSGSSCSVEPMASQENRSSPQTQETTSSLTTTPQTSSVPLSMHPFTYPSFGYYPVPWFHPYLQQVQYQFPYYAGYAGYLMPPPIPRPPHPGTNTNGLGSTQVPWQPQTHSYGVRGCALTILPHTYEDHSRTSLILHLSSHETRLRIQVSQHHTARYPLFQVTSFRTISRL
ncbi:hypothetical protein AX15_001587 [Amanita polypyramis BW_CC]|nr:hypothetical protein AX15_001587 [Amanita polypyramis BW_CC]